MLLSKLRFFAQGQGHTEKYIKMTTYVLCKTLVPWVCSRSQPGIKVSIRGPLGAIVTHCNIPCFILKEACCLKVTTSNFLNTIMGGVRAGGGFTMATRPPSPQQPVRVASFCLRELSDLEYYVL